jgi:hypothetical protein
MKRLWCVLRGGCNPWVFGADGQRYWLKCYRCGRSWIEGES